MQDEIRFNTFAINSIKLCESRKRFFNAGKRLTDVFDVFPVGCCFIGILCLSLKNRQTVIRLLSSFFRCFQTVILLFQFLLVKRMDKTGIGIKNIFGTAVYGYRLFSMPFSVVANKPEKF